MSPMLPSSWARHVVGGLSRGIVVLLAVAAFSSARQRDGSASGGAPSAVIHGQVVDGGGKPIAGIVVRALKARPIAGWLFLDATSGPNFATTTDNDGHYSLPVSPGRYGIATLAWRAPRPAAGSPTTLAYPTCFFPASQTASGALVFTLASGSETVADFGLAASHVGSISGAVAGSDAVPGLSIGLERDDPDDVGTDLDRATAITGPGGRFRFDSVLPGRYRLKVVKMPVSPGQPIVRFQENAVSFTSFTINQPMPPVSDATALWADVPIEMNDGAKALEDVSLWLQPGLRVGGRVVFEGTAERPSSDQLSSSIVLLVPVDARERATPPGRVEPDGTFRLPSVPPGRYSLLMVSPVMSHSQPPPRPVWAIRSIDAGGRDVLGRVLNLTSDLSGVIVKMSDAPDGKLSGTVRGADGAPAADATIYIFPKDRALWNEVAGLTSLQWFWAIRPNEPVAVYDASLRPGVEYLVAATTGAIADSWIEPDALGALAGMAVSVRLGPGEVRRMDLTAR